MYVTQLDAQGWMKENLPNCGFAEQLFWLDETESTNDDIKRMVYRGYKAPLAVFADAQSKGRGRRGRSFQSAAGKGLYFSLLLSPHCPVEELCTLTAWTAAAVCTALRQACGIDAKIKWPNDIVAEGKKLCGILTELLTGRDGAVEGVIIGIGLNVSQSAEDFGELSTKAVSLAQLMGAAPDRLELARHCLLALDKMHADFPQRRDIYLDSYRKSCLTVGRAVTLSSQAGERRGTAEAVEDDFTLRVRLEDGRVERVSSGEVSVRGLYGYI